MEISQSALAYLCFMGGLLGLFLGLCYDFLALGNSDAKDAYTPPKLPLLPLKKAKKHRKPRIFGFCKDLFFCLLAGICTILLFYEYNNGKVRFAALFTMLLGSLLYAMTLRRLVCPILRACRFWLVATVRYAVFFALWPGKKLISLIWRAIKRICQKKKNARLCRERKKETEAAFARIALDGGGLLPSKARERRDKHAGRSKKTV